ncbi:MAG TPA: TetR/AcrR family transcriptional regulator [Candidatus Acidoferrum sp.]|nr:TetR/AcrR family transcriptional regulator [Candidatus Acidoferrum sp.]
MPEALPTPRNSEAKLQHILRVSAQTFAAHGFEGTSMRDISKATDVSLSGLYYYFDSKQRLLYLIQKNAFTSIVERLQERLAGNAHPVARLRILVQNHIDYFLSHPNEMKVLSHEEGALESPFRQEIGAIKRKYFALAHKIFDEVVPEGPNPGLNERVAVLSLFGMMNWVYQWHKPGIDPGADELTDAIVGIFLHGVSATPGAKFIDLSRQVHEEVHLE